MKATGLLVLGQALALLLGVSATAAPERFYSPMTGSTAVKVEAATFGLSIEGSTREVTVDPFFIKTSLVTVKEYSVFLADSPDAATPEYWRVIKANPERPVVGIDLRSVVPFLKWMSTKDDHHVYRLPTEAEWRRAFSLDLLDPEETVYSEFLFDRYSDSFSEWGDQDSPIRNPFGPVLGLNVVALRVWEDRKVERGPIAPDHVSLQTGFRYAFSLSGPGPVAARMLKEAMGKTGSQVSPSIPPVIASANQPAPSALTSTQGTGAFQAAFGDFMRLQAELASARALYKTSHPALGLFEQAKAHPLRQACLKATATLKEKRIAPATYENLASSILPTVKPLVPLCIAQVYGNLIHATLQSHPPRDEQDQSFFNVLSPMLKESDKAQGKHFEMPYPESSLESLVAYYLIGYELERFAELWRSTIGRFPSEIQEKEARAAALGKELSSKFPTELGELTGSPSWPGK